MRVKTKSFWMSTVLIALMALLVLLVVFIGKPTPASARSTRSSICTIQGRVEYPLGRVAAFSDVKDNFSITMENSVAYGTGTLEQHAKLDWTYVTIKINVKNIDKHRSFALYRDGEEFLLNKLTGKSSMTLYEDELPDGNYRLIYIFDVTKGSSHYVEQNYVFDFSVDTTAPEYTVTADGLPVSYYSYINKPLLYSANDPNFEGIYYKWPNATMFYSTLNKTYLVEAKSTNTGWWEFNAKDSYGNTTSYFKVYLDYTLPTLSCSSEAAFGGTTGNGFTVTAADDSGQAKLYVKFEGEEWFYADGNSYSIPSTERNGRYYFYAEDRVGNRTQTSWIVLSTEDPAGRLIKSDSDNSVSFVWNNEYWSAKLDGANYTEGRIISTEGQHVIELSNNASKKKTYTFRIDHCYQVVSQTDPTCTADGKRVSECSQCGDVLEEVLYSTGHIYSVNTTPSSCTDKEHLIYTCSRCGDRYEAEGNYPSGHTYTNEVVIEPTCTEDGLRRSTCENCGYSFDTKIEANGHDYNITDTTSKDGITTRTYTCSECGDSYKQELGDQYEEVSNYVEYLFKQYEPYMWWVLLASAGVWSIVIGVMIAIANKNEDKEKARKMLKNYVIGLVVIAVILVACPFLIRGIAALVT